MNRSTRRQIALGLGALSLTSCGIPPRLAAVPRQRTEEAVIPGIPNARFYADQADPEIARAIITAQRRVRAETGRRSGPLPPIDILAISGGGENGAFGAGLLNAWSRLGTRPTFGLVTGISTGALTAPFAFLGPSRDAQLAEVYTGLAPSDILRSRWMTAAIFNDGIFDTAPLFGTISRFLDEAMLAEIAREYERGRILLVATTNLDARRPVIWNIGAIARSGSPRALDLVRRTLLASAAVPGVFPPVMIDVELDGQPHQEMHVDGGAIAQMFVIPPRAAAGARAAGGERWPARAWLIRNGRLDPEWAATDRRTLSIAGAAISTMIQSSGQNDVLRIWARAQQVGAEYNLAFIGSDFTRELPSPFDPGFMRALYAYGEERMRNGTAWVNRPPGLT